MNNFADQLLSSSEKALLRSLAFFDLFNYPLSLWEWWQDVDEAMSLAELSEIANNLLARGLIERREGWYFLPGRQNLVSERRQRYNFTNHKIKRARRAAALFKILPSVKMVAVANLIGHHNLRRESDIDLFIISSPGRIWLTRLFCAGVMKIFRQRPRGEDKQDKICLSFYAATNGLALDFLRLTEGDVYFERWLMGLYPIYDKDRYLDYLRYKNPWLKNLFPNSYLLRESFADDYFSRNLLDKVLFRVANLLERVARYGQKKILPLALSSQVGQGAGVILNDRILRFYLTDRRPELQKRYQNKLQLLGIYEK